MSSVFKKIKEEKSKKYALLKVRVSQDLAEKIKYICDTNPDVKSEEYLGQLLEESEIDKVHKELNSKKDTKQNIG